jgi:hypothetical protein
MKRAKAPYGSAGIVRFKKFVYLSCLQRMKHGAFYPSQDKLSGHLSRIEVALKSFA